MLIKTNKKALAGTEVIKEFVAGIALQGWEVKSIKGGNLSLKGSYAVIRDGEVRLRAMVVGNYVSAPARPELEKQRERRLLLNKEEIIKIESLMQKSKRLTILPVELFLQNNLIKIKIAIVRAIKKYERKQVVKARDLSRSIAQDLKNSKQW